MSPRLPFGGRRDVLVRLLCCLIFVAAAQNSRADELADLVAPDVTIQKRVGDCKFTEGPAWGPQGFLLFSDMPNNRVVKLLPDGSTADFLKPSGEANGMMFDAAGRLYLCQGAERRVVRIDHLETKELTILADSYDGKRLNSPNDLVLDGHGGLYFSDPRYRGTEPLDQPVMGVYYIDASGRVTRVIEDLERPNGVILSADGKYLYVADPNHRQLYRYEVLGGGKLSAGMLMFTGDVDLDAGGPDGMSIDAHGNVYAAYNGIVVLSRDGKLIGRIPVPEHVSNCAFGGPNKKTLFITARTSLYSLEMRVPGIGLQPASELPGRPQPVIAQKPTCAVAAAEDKPSEEKVASDAPEKADAETPKAESKTRKVKAGVITLLVPESWKQKEMESQLRLAEFEIPPAKGDKTAGELAVFHFGKGGAGGVQANIDRWIGQFESDGRTVKILEFKSDKTEYTLVDLTGTYKKLIGPPIQGKSKAMPGWRVLSVILSSDDGAYFLKLDGPQKTVAAAEHEFRASFGGNAKNEKEQKPKSDDAGK